MKKKRVIPVLLFREKYLVQSKNFTEYRNMGSAASAIKRLSEWDCDEVIALNITAGSKFQPGRTDTAIATPTNDSDLVNSIARGASMPITFGGGIRTLAKIREVLEAGADKVSINTIALQDPDFINVASREFGKQCIVVSIDYTEDANNRFVRVPRSIRSGLKSLDLKFWITEVERQGAGELFLNSVSRDGKLCGYDLELYSEISNFCSIPVIACGGAGSWNHMQQLLEGSSVDAVAAANIFHFQDQSVWLARDYLSKKDLNVRKPSLRSFTD